MENEETGKEDRTQRREIDGQICQCGCGASRKGFSDIGRAAGMRNGVPRVYREAHGKCHFCGLDLDQYGECRECGGQDPFTETDYGLSGFYMM